MGRMGRGRIMLLSNKQDEILKPCESDSKCGNYFYHSTYRYCEICRAKDMC
jgi:hypothetical protein